MRRVAPGSRIPDRTTRRASCSGRNWTRSWDAAHRAPCIRVSASLRIGTFNVLFGHFDEIWGSWAARLPLIRAAVERARPDVLGLQEALPSKLDSLAGAVQPLAV